MGGTSQFVTALIYRNKSLAIAEFVSVGSGAIIAGRVEIATGATVGAGAAILPGVRIGEGAFVGCGRWGPMTCPAARRSSVRRPRDPEKLAHLDGLRGQWARLSEGKKPPLPCGIRAGFTDQFDSN
jgi:hypothetical protein